MQSGPVFIGPPSIPSTSLRVALVKHFTANKPTCWWNYITRYNTRLSVYIGVWRISYTRRGLKRLHQCSSLPLLWPKEQGGIVVAGWRGTVVEYPSTIVECGFLHWWDTSIQLIGEQLTKCRYPTTPKARHSRNTRHTTLWNINVTRQQLQFHKTYLLQQLLFTHLYVSSGIIC